MEMYKPEKILKLILAVKKPCDDSKMSVYTETHCKSWCCDLNVSDRHVFETLTRYNRRLFLDFIDFYDIDGNNLLKNDYNYKFFNESIFEEFANYWNLIGNAKDNNDKILYKSLSNKRKMYVKETNKKFIDRICRI